MGETINLKDLEKELYELDVEIQELERKSNNDSSSGDYDPSDMTINSNDAFFEKYEKIKQKAKTKEEKINRELEETKKRKEYEEEQNRLISLYDYLEYVRNMQNRLDKVRNDFENGLCYINSSDVETSPVDDEEEEEEL